MKASDQTRIELIEQLARALHQCGAAAHHIEAALKVLADNLCMNGQFMATPTNIILSVQTSKGGHYSRLIRLQPGAADLGKLAEVDALVDQVIYGEISPGRCLYELQKIVERPPSKWLRYLEPLAFFMVTWAFAPFFTATTSESIAAGILAVGMCLLGRLMSLLNLSAVYESLGTLIITLCAHAIGAYVLPLRVEVVIIAGLIVLIPGLSLTVALTELSTKNLVAGTARLMGAVIELFKLSFGYLVGHHLGGMLFVGLSAPEVVSAQLLPPWAMLPLVSVAFAVLFQHRLRDIPFVILVAGLSFYAAKWGGKAAGGDIGVFFGAVVLAVSSNSFARLMKRPALITLLPGLLPMVPGSVGYKSISLLFAREVLPSVSSGFSMVIVGVALMAGLSLGQVVVHPRRSI